MASLSSVLKALPLYGQLPNADRGRYCVTETIRKEPKVAKVDKLRTAARDYPCVLCGKAGKTVAAHCNAVEVKGLGKKAPPWLVAYLCQACHDEVDGRAGKLSKAAKRALWADAYWRTAHLWFRDGLVRLA